MKSLDTNILFYAMNADCEEHAASRAVVDEMRTHPWDWIICDQVLFEYYRLVRNPAALPRPLDAATAADHLDYFRNRLGCSHCGYEASLWSRVQGRLARTDFPARKLFDLILAETLRANGVTEFYTRNTRDFESPGYFRVVDPVTAG